MPSHDAKGKRLSGAAQREKKRADGEIPLSRAARKAFKSLGQPPSDEDELLLWGRRMLSATLWLVATDEIDTTRARSVKDLVFAIGATHNRATVESRTKKLETALKERRAGSAIVSVAAGSKVARPPTARGMTLPGPRALGADATVDDLPPPPKEPHTE